jgi:AraC-like DNA-binding protein
MAERMESVSFRDILSRMPLSGDPFHVRILFADTTEIGTEWRFDDVRTSHWRLFSNSRDGAWLEAGYGRHAFAADAVHLVPPWTPFALRNAAKLQHTYAIFNLVGPSRALARELFPRPIALRDARLLRQARSLAPLLRAPQAGSIAACELTSLLYRAIGRAIAGLEPRAAAKLSSAHAQRAVVAPALAWIEAHLHEPIANSELARVCAMSLGHFVRRFRAIMQKTPARYVAERRIAEASRRLAFTGDSIDAIAAATGFPDRFYFTRVFTRRAGVPPAQYRKRIPVSTRMF